MNPSDRALRVEAAFSDQQLIRDVRQLLAEESGCRPGEISDEQVRRFLAAELDGEPAAACIHTLFEQQVERAPAAVALIAAQDPHHLRQLSYRDLDRRANQLAHHLRDLGVGPEVLVGLHAEPSLARIVGVLGILKAGGACLPLEPQDPPQHLAAQLRAGRPDVVVSTGGRLPELSGTRPQQVLLERDWARIGALPVEPPRVEVGAENLAWVLRAADRSVLLEHRSLHRRILSWRNELAPASSDAVLCRGLGSGSAELLEVLWALLHGGRLVLAAPRWNVEELSRKVLEWGITVVCLSPPELASGAPEPGTGALRRVLVSGSPQPRYAESSSSGPGSEPVLCHFYDPPEAGAEVGFFDHLAHGIWVYLLDRYHQLPPAGMVGELAVSGETLARGYLGDPRATAERFVPDPFSALAGERLFRTRDLGRRHEDGTLDLLGSIGRQAWVDGRRIDPEQVEAALATSPLVDDCAVLVREPAAAGAPEMVAYLVLGKPLAPAERRALIEEVVPCDSRPRISVPVAALPLDAEGRVDREALGQPEVVDAALAKSWEEALSSLPEIEAAAVVAKEVIESLPELPLSELPIGGPGREAAAPRISATAPAPPAERSPPAAEAAPRPLAIADGGPLSLPEHAPRTLSEALRRTAREHPERGIVHVRADGSEHFQSYPALLAKARSVLSGLRRAGLRAGDRVILQVPIPEDHFTALWAAILGGITPVTVAVAPSYGERNAVVNKLYNTWKLLARPPVLTCEALRESLSGLGRLLGETQLRILSVDALKDHPPAEIHPAQPADVVFLQLTSGSTGIPKCIQETHRAILAHVVGSQHFLDLSPDDVILNWLPMDHVVPTLTYHLKDVILGCHEIQIPPDQILANPLLWLDRIEAHRVTHTWAPNFAYKLVSDHLAQAPDRTWDLSSVRYFMNAGEQVTMPVCREFLERLAPFGVAEGTMLPAFGMAEVCTTMTYLKGFTVATGSRRFRKDSLKGILDVATEADEKTATVEFIDVGPPTPGVAIRIADGENRPRPEGVIGRLQIRGDVVTPGYLHNREANREAFVGDGWFNTGDLGFILDGHLSITGREKEMIIVRGANFYCYEIEDVVNAVEGVEATFSGACAVEGASTGTEGLAIFFVPRGAAAEAGVGPEVLEVAGRVRAAVASELGIQPAWVVPMTAAEFPKTTSGKIQRIQLRRWLEEGRFDQRLEELDRLTLSAGTLPAWFFRRVWRRRRGVPAALDAAASSLVLLDRLGLGDELCELLRRRSRSAIAVETGAKFARLGADRYRIDPGAAGHYRKLLDSLQQDGVRVGGVVHLFTYQEHPGEISRPEDLERGREQGLYSLLFLAQALAGSEADTPATAGRRRLQVISTFTQALMPEDRIAPEKSPMLGLLKTIEQEIPGWSCRHLDLELASPAVNAQRVLGELTAAGTEHEASYRDGRRWVCRLEPFHPGREPLAPPCQDGGTYLVSGGLGGIGVELARFLLQRYRARLLLVGRTALPEQLPTSPPTPDEGLAARLRAYRELQSLPGEVAYEALDVCDLEALKAAVERATARWQRPLDGILHLAGIPRECLLADESREGLAATLGPKVTGAWALHQLIADRPEALYVSFSSVNGFFGGATAGAYAAANRFLDEFVHVQRAQGFSRAYSLAWSLWDEIGMSRDYELRELAMARGYSAVNARQGMDSLLAAAASCQPQMLIGLDAGKRSLRLHLDGESCALEKPVAYTTCRRQPPTAAQLHGLMVRDRFGRASTCELVRLEELPRTPSGEIDRQALLAAGRGRAVHGAAPQTEEERLLVEIWQRVLGKRVGIHDNFFQIGGDSILAIQAVAKANQAGLALVPLQMVKHQTIAELAVVSGTAVVRAEQGLVTGPLPLSPAQRVFFERGVPDPNLHNQAVMLALRHPVEARIIRRALHELLVHHDALRSRFEPEPRIAGREATVPPFCLIDLAAVPESDRRAALETAAAQVQWTLHLSRGPLLRVVLFRQGNAAADRLLIVLHHLVVDGVSWRLILGDFYTLCQQITAGERPRLPPKTTSFKSFVERLCETGRSEALRSELAYWLADHSAVRPIPVDTPGGDNTMAANRIASLVLTPEETRALRDDVARALEVSIEEFFLTALLQAFESWTGCRSLLVDLVGHGREPIVEDMDLSRTVGWISDSHPVHLDLGEAEDPLAQLRSVRDHLRRVPNGGIGYGLLRYLSGDEHLASRLRARPRPEVFFTYWGQFDPLRTDTSALFEPAPENAGPGIHPRLERPWLLMISLDILDERLHIFCNYSAGLHRRATIERLVQNFADALRSLVAAARNPQAPRTPSNREVRNHQPAQGDTASWDEDPNHVVSRISPNHPKPG